MKRVCLLGASGSIGRQTLDIIDAFPDQLTLVGFSVGEKIHLIEGIITKHPGVKAIAIKEEAALKSVRNKFPTLIFFAGDEGILELINIVKCDLVVNALVGFVGLEPTLHALENGVDVALANKEALVVGGPLVKAAMKKGHSELFPIDSEHVALDKLIRHESRKDIDKIILTASGGALSHLERHELKHVTVEQALSHPTWSMGPKITIDSATMFNKGFEIIEASYLFNIPSERIEVWMHPTSKIHSMIQLVDGTLLADIGLNNMHIPISYALFGRRRVKLPFLKYEPNPDTIGIMSLKHVSETRFPALKLARWALSKQGTLPAAMNGANEVAVAAFLKGELRFDMIEGIVEAAMEAHHYLKNPTLNQLKEADAAARLCALRLVQEWML